MKNRKWISVLVLAVIGMTVLVGACKPPEENGGEQDSAGMVLYHADSSEPYINLDPSVENSNGVMILHNCYETLTYYNFETSEVEPLLAESWVTSEDGKVWDFVIKQGIKFHDGTDLTAEAVKKSIERTVEIGLGSSFVWDSVDDIEVLGDYKIRLKLKYPSPIDLIASGAYAAFIMSPEATEKDSSWFNEGNSAGTGPYTIKRATAKEEVVLEKFDDYWRGWEDDQFANVIVKRVIESSARRQLLEKGDAHISSVLSVTDIKALEQSDNVFVEQRPLYETVIGCLNTEKYPLDNVDFRRALCYAFPYEETVKDVLEGEGAQSYGLIPAGLWGHDEDLMQYHCDLDKAQDYIDRSGVDVKGLALEITIRAGDDAYRNLAQLFMINLKKLGISLQIREMEWDTQWERAKNLKPEDRQDIFLFIWWPDYASPISWFENMVRSEDSIMFNLSYIDRTDLDAKIHEVAASTAVDRERAERLIVEMQEEILDQAYFIHMYDRSVKYVVNKVIAGFSTNPAYPTVVRYYDLRKQ